MGGIVATEQPGREAGRKERALKRTDWRTWYETTDRNITHWMARHGVVLLRIGLGLIFLWFGALKFPPGVSSAEKLAVDTIAVMTFGLLPATTARVLLATWECLIGLGLITGRAMRITLLLLFLQMLGTLTPLVFFPGDTFTRFPWAPTLAGQYIIKNLVLVAAGIVIGATVRGGRLVAGPESRPYGRQSKGAVWDETDAEVGA